MGGLSARQLNWKPSPEQWSIGQCLDHLMNTNKQYFPLIEKLVAGAAKKTVFERRRCCPAYSAGC
ncbi:MAG: DinB family protein [Pyrinomonadaceae bacterium]